MDYVLRKIIAVCTLVQELCWRWLKEPTWRSFSGEVHRIRHMSDQHLIAAWDRVVRTNQKGPARKWLATELNRRGFYRWKDWPAND